MNSILDCFYLFLITSSIVSNPTLQIPTGFLTFTIITGGQYRDNGVREQPNFYRASREREAQGAWITHSSKFVCLLLAN